MSRNGNGTPQYSRSPTIQKFFEDHGEFVKVRSLIIFIDGARLENTSSGGYGGMREPPDDVWERALIIETYWKTRASLTETAFLDFKAYLNGNGSCPAGIRTDDQKLEHLRSLKAAALRARMKLRQAKQDVEDNTPAFVIAKQREKADAAKRNHDFASEVSKIKL